MFFHKAGDFMKDSQKRTCCDISLIHQDEFHDFCRNGNLSSFIRNRKMPLTDLLFTMINRRGDYFEPGTTKLYENCTSGNGNIKARISEAAHEAEPVSFL